MNGASATRGPAHGRPVHGSGPAVLTAVRVIVGGIAAVALAVAGLRLALDAEDLAGQTAFARPEFAAPAVRWAGVAAVAAAQAVGVAGVVWAGHRRRRGDTLFVAAAVVAAVLAGFAAVVLAISGQ